MGDNKYEEIKNVVLGKAKEGKLVFHTIDGLASADIDEFLKQPTDGILYDLNRLPEVILTYIRDPKWINDYAVYLVIKRLKEKVDELEAANAAKDQANT